MRDLLDSTLDGWYSYLASWQAPAEGDHAACRLCADSPFSRLDGLGDWPHDIVHTLVASLTVAVKHVHRSLDELDESRSSTSDQDSAAQVAARSAVLARHAEFLVLSSVSLRIDEMRDVLEHCLEPALQDYLRAECDRGLLQLFATDDRDRPVY